jgi:predicted ATPase
MIKNIFVDNYKCLSNEDIDLSSLNLFIGDNGTGKTAIFESLSIVKQLIVGERKVDRLLPSSTLTRWENRSIQTFEVNIEGNGGLYKYHLEVDHSRSEDKRRIKLERLTFDGRPLFEFELGDVQLYWDSFEEGPTYPFDWERSALPTIMERDDTKKLSWFKRRLDNLYILRIDPYSMSGQSQKEDSSPEPDLRNFASWYRHLSQENPERLSPLFERLKESINGFDVLKMAKEGGGNRTMKMLIDHQVNEDGDRVVEDYSFDELSEGQKAIVALYSILEFTVREDVTLCIDEPENYLSVSEIQPWLMDLAEASNDNGAQAVLISHHPEFIDMLALEKGTLFERPNAGPVRTSPFKLNGSSNLSPSEIFARGWHNE